MTASAIVAALLSSWLLASTSRTATPASASPSHRGRRQGDGARAQPSRSVSAAPLSSAFANEAASTALLDQPAVVARVAARDEHDGRRAAVEAELPADREAVDIRELHVEQHTSGASSRTAAIAPAPSSASPITSNPSDWRIARAEARKLGWSSAITTVLGTAISWQTAAEPCQYG